MASVIVFGPTGQTGSVVARTAAEHGAAKVWLAMRDTSKAIPGLDKNSSKFETVQADLHKPDTVQAAVRNSGAKRAFVYLAHGSSDHMKGTFEALKTGGIDFVVFLSSFTIYLNQALRDIPSSEGIPYVHAQAEANLNDVFRESYVALRAGPFVTNLLQHQKGIAAGYVDLYGGEFEQDNITPRDIGRVGGTILVAGAKNGQQKVYLYGPEILSIHDSIVKIGKTLDRPVTISPQSRDDAYKGYIGMGLPEGMAQYMCEVLSNKGPDKGFGERFPKYDEGVANVKLYTGKPSTSLKEWARDNRGMLLGQN